jgi:hypothetical protein
LIGMTTTTTAVATVDDAADQKGPVAAYGSYASTRNLVERMRKNGVPPVLDRSFFGGLSGSLIAQQRGALRFLGLIDAEFKPTEVMHTIADARDEADALLVLKGAAESAYAEQVALAKLNGTHGQLVESLRKTGLTGSTVQRAIGYYLAITDDLGLPKSPHFRRVTSTPSNSTTTRKPAKPRRAPRKDKLNSPDLTDPPPTTTPTTAEAQKAKYIEMLMGIAAKTDDATAQKDVLDRIERALGLAAPGGTQGSG